MNDKPLPDPALPKSKWSVGTLICTAAGLAVLFALLLWGDLAWSMKGRVVFPMTTKLAASPVCPAKTAPVEAENA